MRDDSISMFKAYDIRTKNSVLGGGQRERLARAVVKYYRENLALDSVVIARDARLGAPALMDALMEAFQDAGMTVYFNPVQISTCQFYYMCMTKMDAGGIMVTASHNPGEYIGLKLVAPGITPIAMDHGRDGGIRKIREYYAGEEKTGTAEKRGRCSPLQLQREYVEYSMALAGVEEGSLGGISVFGEFLSGAAGADFALAFEKAGADFTLSHPVPDGSFPQGDPNPVIESSIAPSRERVRNGHYDMGFCFDGDGDRMDLMYPDGAQVVPGLNLSLLSPYLSRIFSPVMEKNGKLRAFCDVKAVPSALVEIAKSGIESHIIRNGHSFIKAKLNEHRDEGYMVAVEESAHYYMNFPIDPNDLPKGLIATENTLFFALLSARAWKENRGGAARIRAVQNAIYRVREWPVRFSDTGKMPLLLEEVGAAMMESGAVRIKDMDDGTDLDASLYRFGLPAWISKGTGFPEMWAQVACRISRSEDGLVRFEIVASEKAEAERLEKKVREITDTFVASGFARY